MAKKSSYLVIGSTEAYSGKSGIALGIAYQLLAKGLSVGYGKPMSVCMVNGSLVEDRDGEFIKNTLKLKDEFLRPTLVSWDEMAFQKRLSGEDQSNYCEALAQYRDLDGGEIVLVEGASNLEEGTLFNLSIEQMSSCLDSKVLLVTRLDSGLSLDSLLSAKKRLGDRLIGVVLNDIKPIHQELVVTSIRPFLESQGIPVLGLLPRSALLQSVSVGELVHQLKADILCRPDRLDLMVESLSIGAMSVSSALKYFRQARNMAVVTGGDRTDIQLAALESSTQCLILTGHLEPSPLVLSRAEEVEIPVLSVDLDTLATVEIIDNCFGKVRLAEPIKVECISQLMAEHFEIDRLLAKLN